MVWTVLRATSRRLVSCSRTSDGDFALLPHDLHDFPVGAVSGDGSLPAIYVESLTEAAVTYGL